MRANDARSGGRQPARQRAPRHPSEARRPLARRRPDKHHSQLEGGVLGANGPSAGIRYRASVDPGARPAARRGRRHRLLDLAEAARSGPCRRRPGGHRGADPVHARLGGGPLCRPHPRPVDVDQSESSGPSRSTCGRPRSARRRQPSAMPAAPSRAARVEIDHAAPANEVGGARGSGRAARPALHLRDLRRRQAQRVRGGGGRARRRPRPSRRSTRCSSMAASGSARPI